MRERLASGSRTSGRLLLVEAVAQSRLRKRPARSRKCTPEPSCAAPSRRKVARDGREAVFGAPPLERIQWARRGLVRRPCVRNAEGGVVSGGSFVGGAVLGMEVWWRCGVVLWGGARPFCVAVVEGRRGGRRGEGALGRVGWGPGRRSRKRPARGDLGGALLRCRLHKAGVASIARGLAVVLW
jgi:hypothetical protein